MYEWEREEPYVTRELEAIKRRNEERIREEEERNKITPGELVKTIHELPGALIDSIFKILGAFIIMGCAFLPFVILGILTM